jgi:peptide/nickel transport system substrate-binding protein
MKITNSKFSGFYNICITLTLLCTLFLFCSKKIETIVVVYDTPPSTLDPHLRNEILTTSILCNIYEPLIDFDANMKMIPALADYWERIDSLNWRFYLRNGVKFHNNRRLSPEDVVYSLYRPFNLPESRFQSLRDYLDTIIIEDTNTVLLRLKKPHAFLVYDLSGIAIMPEGFEPSNQNPCGTGPYEFVKMDKEHLELKKFNLYWNNNRYFEWVRFCFISDVKKRIEMLKKGEADIITYIPLKELEKLKNTGRVIATTGVATRYLEMDLNKFPFNRIEFRRAVNLGLNREHLVKDVYKGYATPANQFISQGLFGYDYNLSPFLYNPDSARRLIKTLGTLPEIEFDYAEVRANIAEAIIEDLRNIGLNIKPNSLPVEEYWQKINNRKSDFYLIGSVPTTGEGISTLRSYFHTREQKKGLGLLNNTGYSNRTVDALIEKMIANSDLRNCASLAGRVQRILIDDLPRIPVVWEKEIYGVSPNLIWAPRLDEKILIKEIRRVE